MARAASPLREQALKSWIKSGKTKRLVDIADELGISPGIVRKWKHEYNWDSVPLKKPKGAQPGNQNAVGNTGGAPPGNQNAMTHGLLSKHIPAELAELIEELQDKDPIDMLWDMALALYARMIRSMNITFVKDKLDETKVVKKTKSYSTEDVSSEEVEYEIQHAWDKENNSLKAFATANREFRGAIRQYLAAAPDDDERRIKALTMSLQADKLKAEIANLEKGKGQNNTVIIKGESDLED